MSHKNAGMIHGAGKNEGETDGKDNLILNMFTIALLALFFIVVAFAICMGVALYILLVFGGLFFLLMLYALIKGLFWPSKPKKYKESNNQLTCKKGHTVSVYINYDGGITEASNNGDVTCGASVWPKKCPVCGSSWLRPGK